MQYKQYDQKRGFLPAFFYFMVSKSYFLSVIKIESPNTLRGDTLDYQNRFPFYPRFE